ncbi:hypothetical protein FB567DRAFT_343769 [Paraphoma chrysanthemicola]|uniref:Uncharacterized protein n=1 Tax=Paraphoma chrysanthemicola TaxID=798071 RepID=A0A8K0R8G3_9PLEO|nr:hypothetical protein FB567DRAFT_343769 [Paraphoma chrysanthemicola]
MNSNALRTQPCKPFRFLDLPTEIRCMVYELIDLETKRHVLDQAYASLLHTTWPINSHMVSGSSITLIRKSLQVDLLRTCRLVHTEAAPIFGARLRYIAREPLHFIVDFAALRALVTTGSPLLWCLGNLPLAHVSPPSPNVMTRDFVDRFRLYMNHKRESTLRRVSDVDIVITITESSRYSPWSSMQIALEGVRARANGLGIMFEVVYRDWQAGRTSRFQGLPQVAGVRDSTWASTTAVRMVGMTESAFEQRLENLERLD